MDRALLLFWLLATAFSSFSVVVCNTDVPREFLDALREIESVGFGGVCAVGDSGQSLGAYQIMKSYHTDAVQQNSSLSAGGIVKLSYNIPNSKHTPILGMREQALYLQLDIKHLPFLIYAVSMTI